MRPCRWPAARYALAVAATLALLSSLALAVDATPLSGGPSGAQASVRLVADEAHRAPEPGGSMLARIAAGEGPTSHFAFSVLSQAATTISKVITTAGGVPQPPNTTSVNVAAGTTVVFTITVTGLTGPSFVRDFLSPNLTFLASSVFCVTAPASGQPPVTLPPGVSSSATVRDCPVSPATPSFTITAQVISAVTPGTTDLFANVACVSSAGAFDTCAQVALGFLSGTPTPTPTATRTPTPTSTPTPTRTVTPSPTPATVPTNVNVPPLTGAGPCTTQSGATCTITGAVGGQCTKTGSMSCTVSAAGPAGTIIGSIPAVFIPTTAGVEAFACGPVDASLQTVCTFTTTGDALLGGTVTVRFLLAGGTTNDQTGLIGPGAIQPVALAVPQVAIPAVPRPPVQLIPPAPPPLIPPGAPVPPLQGAAPPAFPEVPVIPEAEPLALVASGLAALGALALLRRRWRSPR